MRTPDELLSEALDLPEEDRAKLAESLLASLEGPDEATDPAELERAWLAEVSHRDRASYGPRLRQPDAGIPLGSGFRWVLTHRFRYAIMYRQQEPEIYIVAVAALRRRPGYWRARVK